MPPTPPSARKRDSLPGERTPPLEPSEVQPLKLAVVIPTFNERENVVPVISALEKALAGISWEAIFVDDHSADGTAEHVRELALKDRRVRVVERIGRRGLSSACIEGMMATAAPYIAVMDGDLQHDETILPQMLERLEAGGLDIIVASRNVHGGSMGEFASGRIWLSNLGMRISRLVCRCNTSDPMSGFFLLDRKFLNQVVHRLSGKGFKILVDLLASSRGQVKLGEAPYRFRNRERGESKLDVNVELEYLFLVIDKLIGSVVPTRFAVFVLVGFSGVLVHLAVLALLYSWAKTGFVTAQAFATVAAMISNFLINNAVTFRDRRLRGWQLAKGLVTFCLACSVGAVINVSFAQFLLASGLFWLLAGIAGTAISSVWNYGVNTVITWRRERA